MVIEPDGTVRTSNWTYHGQHAAAITQDTRPPPVEAANAIHGAIRATSERHASNRSLQAAGLTPTQWHVLFQALIEAESSYNPFAKSPKGAYGLGQLMPATARELGVDRTDLNQNLEGAARYLLAQLAEFGSIDLALAAYNAGPHRVSEYGGVPPFSETRKYIARIHRIRARLSEQTPEKPAARLAMRTGTRAPLVIELN
ncbi:MAG: lytic transglycosylase domain-containing protein [Paracoccaceae bacterium]